jgi:tight adherence protein B
MLKSLLLILVCLALLGLSARLLYRGLRQPGTQRVLERLTQGQPERVVQKSSWVALDRAFLRAGLGRPTERLGLWLTLWGLAVCSGSRRAAGSVFSFC